MFQATCDILSSHSGCQENQVGVFFNSEWQAQAEQQRQPLAIRYEANTETQFGSLSFSQYLAVASALMGRQDQTPEGGELL